MRVRKSGCIELNWTHCYTGEFNTTLSLYIQTDIIGDVWGFSSKTPIALSGGFSVETLTGATPSWKTELNRSISTMEDGISGGL